MTALALLAILPAATARSLGEPGTIRVPAADLVGLCGPAPDFSTAETARRAVLAQHERLVRLAKAHDLVPVRPGAVFADATGVARHLREEAARYRGLLSRVAGCVEVAITVRIGQGPADEPESATAESGLAYLRARGLRARAAVPPSTARAVSVLAHTLATCAAGLPVAHPGAQPPGHASATLLVPRPRLPDLLAQIWRTAAATSGLSIGVEGPWPCYIFTAEESSHVPA